MFREQVRLQFFFLNVDKVLAFQRSVGNTFQRRGAAELKAHSPNRSRVRGMNRSLGGGSQAGRSLKCRYRL